MDSKATELIQSFTEKIRKSENFAYVRFGDGELICMHGRYCGSQCDNHEYSRALSDDLIKAFKFLILHDDVYIGAWDRSNSGAAHLEDFIEKFQVAKELVSFHPFASEEEYINEYQYEFYCTLKTSKRKKVFVANNGLEPIMALLGADEWVQIPKITAYNELSAISEKCLAAYASDAIYIYAAGMIKESLIMDMLIAHPDTTHIDVGASYEPFFNGPTRSRHVTSAFLQEFYRELLVNE